jgi:hypothetical protein
MRNEKSIAVAFAWYDEAQWKLLAEVVPDRGELDATFQDWERAAHDAVRMIEANGQVVERVPVDVGALCAWCDERKLPVNGAARAEYVVDLLRQRRTHV